jgi:hypothetical protein
MPCLLLILGIAFPRLILAFLFFFTGYLIRPFHDSFLLPVLGFIFVPLTTLVYAVIINTGHQPDGLYLIALIVCVLADLGMIGGGVQSRRQ